jgi:holo-[acyl-carrier protein] synthase
MIVGTGIDLCSIERIAAACQRFGERFPRRILAANEWARFAASKHPANLLARRFAAKEALSKAIGLGIRHPMHWQNAGVIHDRRGKPAFWLAPELAAWEVQGQPLGALVLHLSLSDDRGFAIAQVIIERT